MRTGFRSLLAALAAGALLAGAAAAGVLVRPPAGSPDPAQMVLQLSDFPAGGKLDKQGYFKDPDTPGIVISYDRSFAEPFVAKTQILAVDSEADVWRSVAQAKRFTAVLRAVLGTPAGRSLFALLLLPEDGDVTVTSVKFGRFRTVEVADEAFELPVYFDTSLGRLTTVLGLVRLDRALGLLTAVNVRGGVPSNGVIGLMRTMATRMEQGLPPVRLSPPVILGAAQEGGTLTANPGRWRGKPAFAYQWQRCDAAGGACTSLAGASAATYVPVEEDVGQTLRVVVTATNNGGARAASSAPIPPVAVEPGPPINVTPPAVGGTPQVGQTLTASTGTWRRKPGSFAYQWQRCDAAATCTDVPGATGQTYTVPAEDAGLTLRVVVTATNPAGSTTAPSPVTAPAA